MSEVAVRGSGWVQLLTKNTEKMAEKFLDEVKKNLTIYVNKFTENACKTRRLRLPTPHDKTHLVELLVAWKSFCALLIIIINHVRVWYFESAQLVCEEEFMQELTSF